MAALAVDRIVKRFGELVALDGVSIALEPGIRHALIGPNGAGKTTLVNVLTGALQPDAGEVFLGDERVTGVAPHARVRRGLARTFQVNQLFRGLTASESVAAAILERRGRAWGWWRPFAADREVFDEARELLETLGLGAHGSKVAAQLPYGAQRLLEIALALATRPRVLLLDEPAAGIAASDSNLVWDAIARLPDQTAVLFIEHDMDLVFRFAERISVLVAGRVFAEGTPTEIAADERVRAVYLGAEAHG